MATKPSGVIDLIRGDLNNGCRPPSTCHYNLILLHGIRCQHELDPLNQDGQGNRDAGVQTPRKRGVGTPCGGCTRHDTGASDSIGAWQDPMNRQAP